MSTRDAFDFYLVAGFAFFGAALLVGQWKAHAMIRHGATWRQLLAHLAGSTFGAFCWLFAWPALAWRLAARLARSVSDPTGGDR